MTKTIYLHVGPHKTGTTVIQKACLDNLEVLAKYGVSFPSLYFSPIGHHDLVDTVRRRAITDDDLQVLASGNDKVLLSSENFIHFTAQDWQYLSERFSQFDVKIIYAWRRSSLKMYSMWQESVKHGGTTPFHAFYYPDLVRPGQSRSLMQTINLDMMVAAFGKDHLHILDFDALYEKKQLVHAFFDLLGVNGSEIDVSNQSDGVKNESLDPMITEILRCLNVISRRSGYPQNSRTREAFSAHQDSLYKEIKQLKGLMNGYVEYVGVGDYFVDKNTESSLNDKYLDNIHHYEKKNRTKVIQVVNQDWLLNDGSTQLVLSIHEKIMEEAVSI